VTIHTTAAGIAHLAERDAPSPVTNAFDALELGRGNTDVTTIADRDDAAQKLMPPGVLEVLAGYPVLGDDDVRNPGRAADRWTWAWRISGVEHGPFVASTAWVTNHAGGAPAVAEPVGFAWDEILQVRSDQVCTVFFNAKTGASPTVHYVYAAAQPAVGVSATYTQRHPLVASYPASVRVNRVDAVGEVVEGSPVYCMTRAHGEYGELLRRSEITLLRSRVFAENARSGRWEEVGGGVLEVADAVSDEPVVTDLRWPHSAGYNVGVWVDLSGVSSTQRCRIELEVRTTRGLVEPPAWTFSILPRAGRYSLEV
jgi:hypothetical protein